MAFDLFITVLLILLNGFFVAAEFALVKVRASQLDVKVQKGNNGLVFNIAEMKCGDPRDGLISIDELLLERASRYFFPLSFL